MEKRMASAKGYLMQIEVLDLKIKQREQEYEKLMQDAMCNGSPGLSPDKVQTSIEGGRMEDAIAEAADIQKEIVWLKTKLIAKRHEIIGDIHSLSKPKHIEVLYLRYVEGKHLQEIADIMKRPSGKPYSYDHVARLHGFALKEFDRIILKQHGNAN